jgi:hypothetical protein
MCFHVMSKNMKEAMSVKSSIAAGSRAMSAACSALDKARLMLVAIGGHREWSDTKDHWRNKLARKVDLSARRIRAILSGEQIRLSADEYLAIEARYSALDARIAAAHAALAESPSEVRHKDAGEGGEGGITRPVEQERTAPQSVAQDL